MRDSRDRLETSAYALLAVRRALLESVIGMPDALIWTAPRSAYRRGWPSMGAVLAGAAAREERWLWPAAFPPPDPFAAETLVQLLYILARRRAVTEELLMEYTDTDLTRPHLTVTGSDRALGVVLRELAAWELQDAAVLRALRAQLQPDWHGVGTAWMDGLEALTQGW